jgi:hypothetical protein
MRANENLAPASKMFFVELLFLGNYLDLSFPSAYRKTKLNPVEIGLFM